MRMSLWLIIMLIIMMFVPAGLWPLLAIFPMGYYLWKWDRAERQATREFNQLVERFIESDLTK